MRLIDDNTAAALTGSRSGDELIAWVWYDGALALTEPLPVSDWSISWDGDARQKVQGSLSLTVKDPDGTLAPWLFNDPLGVGGSRIQVIYRVGGAEDVQVGWYRIDSNSSEESWNFRVIREDHYEEPDSLLPTNYRYLASPTGASVSLSAKDLTAELESDRFLAPEQPVGVSPTVQSEVERLIGGTLPIMYGNFPDANVPKDVVWEDDRLEAVMDLLEIVGASFRMTGEGELEIYQKTRTPVAVLAGGDDGLAINVFRSMNLDGLYNIGVVSSSYKNKQNIDGQVQEVDVPIYGYYEIPTGPLRAGGPFGRRVIKAGNPLMNSQTKVDKAARTMVLDRLSAQRVDLEVTCLPNPALQIGDTVTVVSPIVDGRLVPLAGEVVKASLSGGATMNPMALTVSCLLSDVVSALKGISIGENLTGQPDAQTWGSVNPLRTWEQMNQSWDKLEDA